MDLKIKVLEGGQLPVKGSEDAACLDCFAREINMFPDNAPYCQIKLGFATEIPSGYHAKLFTRSSISNTGWFMGCSVGIIDPDYRGEWEVRLYPRIMGFDGKGAVTLPFPYKVGDRVAQFMIENDIDIDLIEVEKLDETLRGEGGHGSTGTSVVEETKVEEVSKPSNLSKDAK